MPSESVRMLLDECNSLAASWRLAEDENDVLRAEAARLRTELAVMELRAQVAEDIANELDIYGEWHD